MRILLVDDDPTTLEPIAVRLRGERHDVETCTDGESAWAAFEEGAHPDIVVLDWMLPGIDGLELCRRIRAREQGPYVYIVMLTGRASPGDLVAGFGAGADDYLAKPFDHAELDARLRAGERIVELQNALIRARETLRRQAMQDPLTGILNHRAILESLERELNRSRREETPLSLVLADLDKFKDVNDTHGHLAGDRILIEVASRMRGCLRSYDALGRYGGEEFLIVLPNCGSHEAESLAERIRAVVSGTPVRAEGADVTVTLSQGIATWTGSGPMAVDALIRAADAALYSVKASGRDAVRSTVFAPGG